MSSLYIHFPFCLYKCFYCDFNSYAKKFGEIPFKEYVLSLFTELKIRKELFLSHGAHFFGPNTSLKTIFFGGGTPSLMSKQDVECILNEVGGYFKFDPDIEITLEANPKTISRKKLKQLKEAGINRISLGVQSLHDSYLKAYGRIHTADDARKILGDIALTGFKSWNADLMFGFPGQTSQEFEEDLLEIVSFSMPHLSCYALTVEEVTPYYAMIKQGRLMPPDDDLQAVLFQKTPELLKTKGYNRYEVSNFSLTGKECRHNLTYWNYGEYLGLGAGAVSFFHDQKNDLFGYRTTNVKSPDGYMRVGAKNFLPLHFETESISKKTAMSEFMMMGLRLQKGVDSKRFFELFGMEINEVYRQEIIQNRRQKWMQQDPVALTQKGHQFSNRVISSFLDSSV